jgi:hypothetical protein
MQHHFFTAITLSYCNHTYRCTLVQLAPVLQKVTYVGPHIRIPFSKKLRGPPHPSMAGQISGVGQGLERRSVVSSFIFHFTTSSSDQPLVALFKRSDKVRTYK